MPALLRFARALLATNLKAALALRASFWISVFAMALNNFLFFSMWLIFFDRFEEVRGFRLADMAALFGVVNAGFGATVVVFGGLKELARYIDGGDLDAFLCQPKPVLLHALGSGLQPSGFGDLTSGAILLALSGVLEPRTLVLALLAVAISATVLTSTGVVIHCLAFWLGRVDSLARPLWEVVITFSLYPSTIFGGSLRILLYTVLPAGFIGYLPAELLRDPSALTLGAGVAAAVGYAGLAAWVFERGLRRYASGSRFGVRA